MSLSHSFAISAAAFALAVAMLIASRLPAAEGSAARPSADAAWQIVTAAHEGDGDTDRRIARLQQRLSADASDATDFEQIGWLFVEKARETGDGGFHHLALAAADGMEARDARPAAADLLRGHALHGLHRFEEALAVARRAVATRGLAYDHGLLGDVLVDQGRVEEAVAAYQAMMERKPGAESFARAGHVRFLTGDLEGAVEAMQLAARAVSPRTPERFVWIWARLSDYQLRAGRLDAARASAERAAAVLPGSAVARLAQARVLLAEDRFEPAIPLLDRATRGQPAPEALWMLAEAQRAAGREEAARTTEQRLLARGGHVDPRGFALWLAHTRRETPRALALARQEIAARQDPYTLDALAWAELAAGDPRQARALIERALAFGTREPRFELHAAAVHAALGEPEATRLHAARAANQRHLLLPSERELLATLAGRETYGG